MSWFDSLFGGGDDESDDSGSSSGSSDSSSRSGSSGSSSSGSSSSGGGGFWGGIGGAIDDARDTVEDTARDVGRSVDRAVDQGRDVADDIGRSVDRGVDRARDTVDDVSRDVDRSVDRTVDRAQDTARDVADDVGRSVDRGVDRARDTVEDTARDVGRSVDRAADQARDTADDVGRSVDRSVDQARDAVQDAGQSVDRAADQARDVADDVGRGVGAAAEEAGVEPGDAGRVAGNLARGNIPGAAAEVAGVDEYGRRVGERFAEDGFSGAVDEAAGPVGEWAGTVPERYGPGTDVLLGSADEAVGRAADDVRRGDYRSAAGELAGGFDDAAGRGIDEARAGNWGAAADEFLGPIDETGLSAAGAGAAAGAAAAEAGEATWNAWRQEAQRRTAEARQAETVVGYADAMAGGHDEAAGRIVDEAGVLFGGADDAVWRAGQDAWAGDYEGAARELDRAGDEGVGRVASEVWAGDWFGAVEAGAEESWRGYRFASVAGDELAGSADDWAGQGFDQETAETLTGSGGWWSESQEADLAQAASAFSEDVGAAGDYLGGLAGKPEQAFYAGLDATGWVDPEQVSYGYGGVQFDLIRDGEGPSERFIQGAAGIGNLANVWGHAGLAESGYEVAQNADEADAQAVASTGAAVGAAAGAGMVRDAKRNPFGFAGELGAELLLGAGAGKVLGRAGRGIGDRVRTAGGKKVDPEDLTSRRVREGKEDFPGAQDPDLYKRDPAEAVRRQAEDYTPSEIDEYFAGYGYDEGVVLKKGLDVEPEGPGRGVGGFTSAPDEVTGNFAYENPGSFFGPEFSTYFVRQDAGESSFSWRPGLPSMGGRPTGVLAKTDVENPSARTQEEFITELRERAGEETALTKPAGSSQLNPGEIEAVVPPGAEFSPVRGGLRGVAERFGVGSRFYTEVGGRRVPLRTVAAGDRPDADVADAADAAAGARSGGESLDYYVQAPEQAIDRPLPTFTGGYAGNPADMSQTPTYTSSPERAADPTDYVNPYDPYNGGSVFSEWGADHVLDVDRSVADRRPSDPSSTRPDGESPPSSAPPIDDDVYYSSGPIDEYGVTPSSSPEPAPPSSGGGPTSDPDYRVTSDPSSYPPSDPSTPPSDPDRGPPSDPTTPTSSSRIPPRDPDGPTPVGSYTTPLYPDDPAGGSPSRTEYDPRERKDEEEFVPPWVTPYDVAFSNPIATGLEVLFGNIGPSPYPSPSAGRHDPSQGPYRPYALDEAAGVGGPIDETGGLAGRQAPIDEAGDYEREFTGPAYRPSPVEAGGPEYEPAEGPYRPTIDEAGGYSAGPIDETGGLSRWPYY